jgi:hypothetical protein
MAGVTQFTEDIGNRICERIADGESVRKICLDPAMPAKSTLFKWLYEQKAFSDQYTRAREVQMETMAEEIIDIADDTSQDTKTIQKGDHEVEVMNAEWINRCRLQVDTRKWLMSKMAPKRYGDKVQTELSGPDGGPLQAQITVEFVKPIS